MRFAVSLLMTLICSSASAEQIQLSDQCPTSFINENGGCKLISMYQSYSSVQNRGVGGTRTGLPPYRDGFAPELIDLGRYLFFDPILSGDQTRSCASCHDPEMGFSDGRRTSLSMTDTPIKRSAPTLWNAAFLPWMFWDGRAQTLEEQALMPIVDPHEMGANVAQVEARLNDSAYKELFAQVYPGNDGVAITQVAEALAAFQSSLVSLTSRYDRYAHGDQTALTNEELKGLNVFRSFVARCAECHTPPLFTNNQIAVIGTPRPENGERDRGAELVFNSEKWRGAFKVPTLRNVTKTAPYMHDGQFENLLEVMEFYNGGRGHALEEDEELLIHWHITSPDLRHDELEAIVSFLHALEDERAMPEVPSLLPSGLTPVAQRAQ